MPAPIPDPALVVLVGASGSGKSTWAAQHYRAAEVVSSDALRAVLGSGEADLDASVEAFDLLDRIVAARLRRGLTVVVDTLGLDRDRRRRWQAQADLAGLPAIAVLVDTPAATCRQRNRARDRPVPAAVLTGQVRRIRGAEADLVAEGWTVHVVTPDAVAGDGADSAATGPSAPALSNQASSAPGGAGGPEVVLQLSRFPWGADPRRWLREVALAADAVGFAGIALMDHLIQIPQVDRAWEPIAEPWVSLGFLAGLDNSLRLGTLVSPITFREPGITAKAAATLDVLSGGRAFLGLGAGWWAREHAGFGLDFPSAGVRLDRLARGIEIIRALTSPGMKPWRTERVDLPETTSYPRPVGPLPIIVGGSGEQRTLRIVAELADGCNLPSDEQVLTGKLDVLRRHCAAVGRDPDEVMITVLDVPLIGADRDDVARRVERLRGRSTAATFAARHHAGLADDHVRRYRRLAALGVRTVFCALPDLDGPDDLDRLAPVLAALRAG